MPLPGFLQEREVNPVRRDHFLRYAKLLELSLAREQVHQIQHQILNDHSKSASANLPLLCQFGNGFQGIVLEPQLDALILE